MLKKTDHNIKTEELFSKGNHIPDVKQDGLSTTANNPTDDVLFLNGCNNS